MTRGAAVDCPVHGTHGNLSNDKCWWCATEGKTPTHKIHVPVPDDDDNREVQVLEGHHSAKKK